MTLLANDLFLSVARPKSPILTEPVVPVMKMLSHLRSRWMMGGVRVCRKYKPLRICRHQFFNTFGLIRVNLRMYLHAQSTPVYTNACSIAQICCCSRFILHAEQTLSYCTMPSIKHYQKVQSQMAKN